MVLGKVKPKATKPEKAHGKAEAEGVRANVRVTNVEAMMAEARKGFERWKKC